MTIAYNTTVNYFAYSLDRNATVEPYIFCIYVLQVFFKCKNKRPIDYNQI